MSEYLGRWFGVQEREKEKKLDVISETVRVFWKLSRRLNMKRRLEGMRRCVWVCERESGKRNQQLR